MQQLPSNFINTLICDVKSAVKEEFDIVKKLSCGIEIQFGHILDTFSNERILVPAKHPIILKKHAEYIFDSKVNNDNYYSLYYTIKNDYNILQKEKENKEDTIKTNMTSKRKNKEIEHEKVFDYEEYEEKIVITKDTNIYYKNNELKKKERHKCVNIFYVYNYNKKYDYKITIFANNDSQKECQQSNDNMQNFMIETKKHIKQFDDEKLSLIFAENTAYKNITIRIKEDKLDFDKFAEITRKAAETTNKHKRAKKII